MHEGIRQRLFDALVSKPLVSNAFRGTLVEAIIAEALEPEWRWCADGWGAFDFEGPNGIGLEVKQSAARQSWHEPTDKECVPRFDIAERSWQWRDNAWHEERGRAAAIYIFAHHPVFDPALADHRDPLQWDFYVLATTKLPAQKSIGLSGVRSLAAPVSFADLKAAVHSCLASLPR